MKKIISSKIILAFLVVILATVGVFSFKHFHQAKKTSSGTSKPVTTVNYKPATVEEKQQADANKDQIVKNKDGSTRPSGSSSTILPYISYASQTGSTVEVDAYVNGVAEDGGTCTLKAVLGGSSITRTNPAFMNATTSNCKNFMLSRSDFPAAGSWSVTIQYQSKSGLGTSAATPLDIK